MLRNPRSTRASPCPIGCNLFCVFSYHSVGVTVPRHATAMSLRPIRRVSSSSLTATNPIQFEFLLHLLTRRWGFLWDCLFNFGTLGMSFEDEKEKVDVSDIEDRESEPDDAQPDSNPLSCAIKVNAKSEYEEKEVEDEPMQGFGSNSDEHQEHGREGMGREEGAKTLDLCAFLLSGGVQRRVPCVLFLPNSLLLFNGRSVQVA
ncbi:unnamed protein product, partial [Cuscuta campestris]